MIIHNGDHAEYEIENSGTPREERADWPYPSFDAMDWAKAFVKHNPSFDVDTALAWFAGALMRGFDENRSRAAKQVNRPEFQRYALGQDYDPKSSDVYAIVRDSGGEHYCSKEVDEWIESALSKMAEWDGRIALREKQQQRMTAVLLMAHREIQGWHDSSGRGPKEDHSTLDAIRCVIASCGYSGAVPVIGADSENNGNTSAAAEKDV